MKPNQKALVLTSIGYLVGVLGQIILFPLFGLGFLAIGKTLLLGIAFTFIAYLGNLFGLWLISCIESNTANTVTAVTAVTEKE